MNLDEYESFPQIDSDGILDVLSKFPYQISDSQNLVEHAKIPDYMM